MIGEGFLESLHGLLMALITTFSKWLCECSILWEPLTDLVNVVCSCKSLESTLW